MKQLFELALQLEPPWRVVSSDIDFDRRRVDLSLGFRAGSRFPCPQCGRACPAFEFTEGTWRQPDMVAFEAFVKARADNPLSGARRR
jgi:transposase